MFKLKAYILVSLALALAASPVWAATLPEGHSTALTFLWIAIILFIAKVASYIERFGQPAVLGELIVGIILGNLVLLGFGFFEPIKSDTILSFLAEIGVVFLLFQIGLESNITELRKVGRRAVMVALVGMAVPFILGTFVIGPWFFAQAGFNAHLFIGAALTATSVGITARIFKDLGKIDTQEAKIVLGASVIDDVLGLVILAVVSAVVITGSVDPTSVGIIITKALGFLATAIIFGQVMSRQLTNFMARIQTSLSAEFAIALSTGLFFAYLADQVGLAPIVGAFAAGLILEEVHFKDYSNEKIVKAIEEKLTDYEPALKEDVLLIVKKHTEKRIEDLVEQVGFFFVPIFFVVTGMNVNLGVFTNPKTVGVALIVAGLAIVGKLLSGLMAGSANKLIVGLGMVPRGEVGLIFAAVGQSLGVISEELFSIIVIMVIITTLLTPLAISYIYQRTKA